MSDLMLPSGMKNQSVTIFGEKVTVSDELVIRNCVVLPHKDLKNSYKNEILM
jgi:mannose-1-phosphate guanylyltransferase